MNVDVRPLRDRDDALRLTDLVYSTYGLTYHRGFLYDADRLLDLVRARSIASLLAFDPETGRVVGHLATIRPWFEIADPLPAGQGPPVVEVGLSIVDPAWRGRQVQSTLALATVLDVAERTPDLRGFYMKCVTTHPYSQRSARRFQGRATALFPAGVPAWVRSDAAVGTTPDGGPPTSTVLVHCPYGTHAEREVAVPADHAPFLEELYGALGLARRVRPVRTAAVERGDTRVATWFDPARRQGVAWVRAVGGDLVEAVLSRVAWLLGGHMEHVTVLLPLDVPFAAAAVPHLEAAGLFFGGVIPDLEGADTLVLERVEVVEDLHHVHVVGEEAERLRDRVLAAWQRSRSIDRPMFPGAPADPSAEAAPREAM